MTAYCGFSMSNRIKRKTLDEAEIARECAAIRALHFEHLLLVTGEHQSKVGMDYFRRHLPAIRRQFSRAYGSAAAGDRGVPSSRRWGWMA